MLKNLINVRQATLSDVPTIVTLEKQVWQSLGTPVLTAQHFRTWLELNPALFLVAEQEKKIVGYTYAQMIDFCFADIPKFISYDLATDHGFTRSTHKPDGNSFYGLSTASIQRGAGRALHGRIFELLKEFRKRYLIGFPRISGFHEYLASVELSKNFGIITPKIEKEIALWYTIECAKLVGGKIWDICPKQPTLSLPKPIRPDPVLSAHLTEPDYGIVGVVPKFMDDPESRDYAVFSVYQCLPR